MNDIVIVSLISFAGTLGGSLIGVLGSAKLTNYKIEQLEKKVETHNNFAVRTPLLEQKIEALEKRVKHLEEYHVEKI